MPQTTDQLKAAIMNLPCKPPRGTSERREHEDEPEAVLRAYIGGHRDARHAAAELVSAVPLVAEAPREPVAGLTISETPAGPAFEVSLGQGIFSLNLPPGVYPLYVAPPVSVAPMPEPETQTLNITEEIKHAAEQWLDGICDHDMRGAPITRRQAGWTVGIVDFSAGYHSALSHLRTAPLTLSDEQRNAIADRAFEFFNVPPSERNEGVAAYIVQLTEKALSTLDRAPRSALSDERTRGEALALSYVLTAWKNVTPQEWGAEHQLLRKVLADASRVLALLASVAPQPEQPNTEQPHLADNGRKPVQGLDAAAGVALPRGGQPE